jgi:hypothetical protein
MVYMKAIARRNGQESWTSQRPKETALPTRAVNVEYIVEADIPTELKTAVVVASRVGIVI